VRASDAGWGGAETVGALGGGAVLLAWFVLWERRAAAPMLPLTLFRTRAFTAANATGFLMFGSIFAAAFLMSQYFQFGLGYSPLSTGLRFLPWTATPVVVAPLAGALSDRIGQRPLMVSGLLVQALGLAWIATHAAVGLDYGTLVLPLVIAGIGISMAIPTTTTAAISAVGPRDVGKASGVQNTLTRFGSVFAVAIASAVFAANGHFGAPAAFIAGFRPALAVVAGLSALGAVCALGVSRRAAVAAQPEPVALVA
jgi:MFS family permease